MYLKCVIKCMLQVLLKWEDFSSTCQFFVFGRLQEVKLDKGRCHQKQSQITEQEQGKVPAAVGGLLKKAGLTAVLQLASFLAK